MQGNACQVITNTSIFPIRHVSSCKARHIYIYIYINKYINICIYTYIYIYYVYIY